MVRSVRPTAVVLSLLGFAVALLACGSEATELPAIPAETFVRSAQYPTREPIAPALPRPAPPGRPLPSPSVPAEPTAAAAAAYRVWMEEARVVHPYAEPVERMWAVMICESGGNASVVGGVHHGLFQYSATTWAGAWNPYRDDPILDPRAQIFATAKAWQDGNQSWWGCY